MAYETLLTDLSEGVVTVTLNRPDKLNAFNTVMSRELIDFFHGVNGMDEVRAVVITGPAGRSVRERTFPAAAAPSRCGTMAASR